ncbi:hypothetical protein T11_3967 [Trichinella zimbabwensis]|uniref:Uncharacterized protein n=1 Tax=Trichinella zimbabwensis TaxID=268475 RepID=A0A0V1GU89_9BILA|nr:hypothetical protein T11_3967 [Trichinella zimbabwensis]
MDGEQVMISFTYDLECTIHTPGFAGCQQSNVITLPKQQDVLGCTSVRRKSFPDFVCLNSSGICRS